MNNNPRSLLNYYSEEINAPIYFRGTTESFNFSLNTQEVGSNLHSALKSDLGTLLYRGTHLDNLKLVIDKGIDNIIPNQGFWGNRSLSKCLEYGELIMCYDGIKIKESWKQFDLNSISESKLNSLKDRYLSFQVNRDKTKIFFSMFPEDRRGKVDYEMPHGYYLPESESQKDCLKALILLGSGDNWLANLITKFYMAGGTLKKDGKDLIDMEQVKKIRKQISKQS